MRVLYTKNEVVRLDKKDEKILSYYTQNCRIPLTTLAKRVGLSRTSVEYRLQKYAELGLITGHKAIINIRLLGFRSYHVFLSLETLNEETILKDRALESKAVNTYITYRGRFGSELSIMAKTPEEFAKEYAALVEGLTVVHEAITILSSTIRSLVLPGVVFESQKIDNVPKILDDLDFRILDYVSEHANDSFRTIAKKLNTTSDVISYRIKQLNNNYILGFRPALNYNALGYSIHAVLVTLNKNSKESSHLLSWLKNEEPVLWCVNTIGSYDLVLYVLSTDIFGFHEFVDRFKQECSDAIKSCELLFAHTEFKYSYMAKNIPEQLRQQGVEKYGAN